MDDPKEVCLKLNLLLTYEKLCEEFPVENRIRMLRCCVDNTSHDINDEAFDVVLKCLKLQGDNLSWLPFELHSTWKSGFDGFYIIPTHAIKRIKQDLPILKLLLQKADVYGIDFNARNPEGKTLYELVTSDERMKEVVGEIQCLHL